MPVDQRSGHRPGKQRVLSDIFEIAAVARFAREVDAARKHGVVTGRACFGADHRTACADDLRDRSWPRSPGRMARAVLGMKLLRTPIDASVWV